MSALVIELPPRSRLATRAAGDDAAPVTPADWHYLFSSDGRTITRNARAAAALLPRADQVVAVAHDADVAWHRVMLPRAGAAKMRQALVGVLEDAVLDDIEDAHFALAPNAAPGAPCWVAVVNRPWLAQTLAALESRGLVVDRVVCAAAPGGTVQGHFWIDPGAEHDSETPQLSLANADGVQVLRINGSLARALVPQGLTAQWSATPAAAAAAERWLGAPVAVLPEAERLLAAARSPWNLRQFDLAPRNRGLRALREGWRRWGSPAWRPVRWGMVALLAVQLVGLNAWAWRLQSGVDDKRRAMVALLQTTHPKVRSVLDAPLQMQRETEALRAAAGKAGDADLEVLLAAAAAAWPDGVGQVQSMRFENGQLTLAAPGLGEVQFAPLRQRLGAAGFDASWAQGRATITRAAQGSR
jgi:general secretion pathway protein L